jgi:hypothetical protein
MLVLDGVGDLGVLGWHVMHEVVCAVVHVAGCIGVIAFKELEYSG